MVAIASISLLVSGIGIMTSCSRASWADADRRPARVGATRQDIIRQFLIRTLITSRQPRRHIVNVLCPNWSPTRRLVHSRHRDVRRGLHRLGTVGIGLYPQRAPPNSAGMRCTRVTPMQPRPVRLSLDWGLSRLQPGRHRALVGGSGAGGAATCHAAASHDTGTGTRAVDGESRRDGARDQPRHAVGSPRRRQRESRSGGGPGVVHSTVHVQCVSTVAEDGAERLHARRAGYHEPERRREQV
jgi:hypothetical protein